MDHSITNPFYQKLSTLANTSILIVGRVGSKAYGTDVPTSDEDFMAVCSAGPNVYIGLDDWCNDGTFETKVINGDPVDATAYEFKKFVRLCTKFNPNVIPLLFLREPDYIYKSEIGKLLIDNRDMFLSRDLYAPFYGYALSQYNKVNNGLTGKMGAKRKDLAAEYGYDTKFAMHSIRLLRMGIEALDIGEPKVFREYDALELKAIRFGSLTLLDYKKLFEGTLKYFIDSYETSKLPEHVDYERINKFVQDNLRKIL